jgi:hypothetical protein
MLVKPVGVAMARLGNTSAVQGDEASQQDTAAWVRPDALHRRVITVAAARRARTGRRSAKPW